MTDLSERFRALFPGRRGQPARAFAPYRVCPLGAHVDHQHGLISGFAIDRGVELCYAPSADGQVRLYSDDFPGEVCFSPNNLCGPALGDWGDYARGAAWALSGRGMPHVGIVGVVRGSLPIGGLSSSASVTLCYLQALAAVNEIELTAEDLITLAHRAESGYVGVNVGTLDPSCEVLSVADHLLYLDTRDGRYERIARAPGMPAFETAVFYSGVPRRLGSGFNNRVDELRAAAWYLKAMEGMPLGPFAENRLRDVPEEAFLRREADLPQPFRRRARHFYTECGRVRRGVDAWRRGDMAAFGQLVFESGQSSIENYETGSPELIELYRAMREAPGVYGGRFSGAGFRGCCVALVDPARREQAAQFVERRYLDKFPAMKDTYSCHFCGTRDGVGVGR
ncbi:MAG: GHMP kinase [Clostridiales bacterium]|nr:GHMP kinase [Clostridiales bacterium]